MELVLKDLTHASAMEYPLIPSPATDVAGQLTPPRDFNLMFQTSVGAMADASSSAYLRPGTYICSRFPESKGVDDLSRPTRTSPLPNISSS
jgi:glycyl-tRNA synthetase